VIPASGLRPVEPLPVALRFEEGPVTFEAAYRGQPDGSLTALFRLDVTRGQLTAEQVMRLRAVLRGIGKDGPKVKFERTSLRLLEAGRGREALDEIRRLVAAEPREVGHQLRLAMALSKLGLVEAAREAARRGVAMAPASGWAHRILRGTLEVDLVGRGLEPGCDISGAIAAQRRAAELEPANAETRAYVGTLLLHGEDCRLFGRGANPAEAVEVFGASPKPLGDRRAEDLMQALLAVGQDAEALALARERPKGLRRDWALLAALALVEGPAAAVREAERLTPSERGDTIQGAAALLSRRRAYALAAQLLEGATAGAENVARYQDVAAGLRRAQRLDEHPPDPSRPQSVAAALARAGVGLEPVEGLLATARQPGPPERARRTAHAVVSGTRRDLQPEVVADLAAAQQARWEPNGADGGRLEIGPVRAYLLREKGSWKVLAVDGEAASSRGRRSCRSSGIASRRLADGWGGRWPRRPESASGEPRPSIRSASDPRAPRRRSGCWRPRSWRPLGTPAMRRRCSKRPGRAISRRPPARPSSSPWGCTIWRRGATRRR
jgi:hypothetical protein